MGIKKQELELREIQKGTLEILKEIDYICKSIGIKYWGMYGTLLGAIRHKGFIPWDDDLDIGMRRNDYEKFVKYCIEHSENLYPYTIDNNQTVINYPFNISRFCDNRYKVVFDGITYESGLFVDIYPFDGMGEKKDIDIHNRKKWIFKLWQKCVLGRSVDGILYGANIKHKIMNLPIILWGKIKGNQYFINKLEKEGKKFNWDESIYVGTPTWEFRAIQFPKEFFEEIIEVPYEDYMISVPKAYDKILKMYYGDYMKLPPESERFAHHFYHAYKWDEKDTGIY